MDLCIGLDAHRKTCVYVVKDKIGTVVDSGRIPSTPVDLEALAKKYPGVEVVLEASGVSEWIYDCLVAVGSPVVLCHPMNIFRILGKKRDEVDANFLVDARRLGILPISYMPPVEFRQLRQLCRRCAFLTHEATRLKNRLHGLLNRQGLRLLENEEDDFDDEVPDLFAKKHREDLLRIPDPEIPVLLELLDAVEKQRTKSTAEVRKVQDRPGIQNLRSIPGFGPLVALTVYAEMAGADRFKNAEAVACYFGLVASEKQSGETRVRGHITRRGSPLVRWLLVQAGWVHVQRCPTSSISRKYHRLAKTIGKKRAIVAVARMLAKISYCLLKEKRGFTTSG